VQTAETLKAIREILLKNCGRVKTLVLDGLLITFVRGKTDHQYRGGQLLWLVGHFEKATYSGGPYLINGN